MYKGCILCYGFKGDRLDQLRAIAEKKNIGLRLVGDEDLEKKVEDLLPAPEDLDNAHLPTVSARGDYEYLLFAIEDQEELYDFLDRMREAGLYVPLKAGLTQSNLHWKLSYLIDQNREEHEYFKKMENENQAGDAEE